MQPQHLHALGRDIVTRAIAIVGLAGIASLFVEGSVAAVSGYAYAFTGRTPAVALEPLTRGALRAAA